MRNFMNLFCLNKKIKFNIFLRNINDKNHVLVSNRMDERFFLISFL